MPVEGACAACGGKCKLSEDVSEMLEYIPASFKVIRHVRPKLCCTRCDVIVQAAAPSSPIDRGLAGPGFLAHVLVSKYADHLPLYRQSGIYARQGVDPFGSSSDILYLIKQASIWARPSALSRLRFFPGVTFVPNANELATTAVFLFGRAPFRGDV
jgi:zinc-finger binding domain of transposase IS66/Transposase IS66 family